MTPKHYSVYDTPNLVGNVDQYNFWNNARSFVVIGKVSDIEREKEVPHA